jgi:hypothetical protein
MHAMIRSYSGKGAKELVDVIEKRKKDVEEILRSVSGLVNYSMVRTKTGGFGSKPPKPEVHEGAVVVQLN